MAPAAAFHVRLRPLIALRWLARAASLVSIALMLAMATDHAAWPTPRQWVLLACFPCGVVLGMLVAWRREILGGLVALSSLIAFHALLATDGKLFSAGPWFVVFASPALVLLVCGIIDAQQNASPKPRA